MLSAFLDFVIDALGSAFGWLLRVARGAFGGAAVDAGVSVAEMTGGRRDRRRVRRHFKALAATGQSEELIRAYRMLGRSDELRTLRLDALEALVAHDRVATAPVLREVIEGPEDAWTIIGVLHTVARHRVVDVVDVVRNVEHDPRPVVASSAASVRKRLLS